MSHNSTTKISRAEVASIAHHGRSIASIAILRLKTIGEVFPYREGQYLSIALPGTTQSRSYSMAAPCDPNGVIELHIRIYDHGLFSKFLRERVSVGTSLTITGPYGDCVWDVPDNMPSTVLLLATGTGIAPLKAILERHLPTCAQHDIWLYWGGATSKDLYAEDEFKTLEKLFPNFHYLPVLTEPETDWTGAIGFVQEVAASMHSDLSDTYIFACGAPMMVKMARERFISCNGLPEERFYCDSFEVSPTTDVSVAYTRPDVAVSASLPDGSMHSVRCEIGQTLMSALVLKDLVSAVCGGNQSCGTCRVTIKENDLPSLPEPSRAERRLLSALPNTGPLDRLSCQLKIRSIHDGLHFSIPPSEY